jgi:hypothetical protein
MQTGQRPGTKHGRIWPDLIQRTCKTQEEGTFHLQTVPERITSKTVSTPLGGKSLCQNVEGLMGGVTLVHVLMNQGTPSKRNRNPEERSCNTLEFCSQAENI